MKKVYILSLLLLFVLLGWSQSTSASQQITIKYENGNNVQINANDVENIEFTEAGWSQTMTIKYKNGSTQIYDMNDIEAITFPQEGNGGSGSGSSSTFTITRDGEVNEVEITDWIYPQFTNKALKKGAGFSLDDYPLFRGTIYIIFPLEQYGEYLSPSYFPVGYSDFDSYATDIVYVSIEQAGWYGEYISGSARVVKNNGNSITVQFNNYMFYVERNSRSRKYTLNGTLEFKCYMYD